MYICYIVFHNIKLKVYFYETHCGALVTVGFRREIKR